MISNGEVATRQQAISLNATHGSCSAARHFCPTAKNRKRTLRLHRYRPVPNANPFGHGRAQMHAYYRQMIKANA